MNPVGEMELLVAGIQSASEAVTTETDPGDRGVCSCVNQPVPCRVDQRHPSPLPYTQPLSVTTDIEYELDWNLFGGSEEANPSLGNKDASGVWRGALMIAATPGVPAPHLAGLPTPPEQRTTSQSHTLTPGADIQLTGKNNRRSNKQKNLGHINALYHVYWNENVLILSLAGRPR